MDVKNSGAKQGEARVQPSKSEKKQRTALFLKNTFFGLLYSIWGYFLGGLALPFGAYPFGIALLAAADRRVFYIYAGLCVSAWGNEARILLIGVYTAVVLLRLLVRFIIDPPWSKEEGRAAGELTLADAYPDLFGEHISLRMASAAIGAFAIGVYRLIEGGMLYYDMYGTVISVVCAPLAVLLISGFFVKTAGKYRKLLSFLALGFGVIYAVGDLKLYGIALGAAGCMFVTLYVTRRGGTVLGILSGALLGLAVSIETVPLFAFAALVAGLLYNISVSLAVGAALSVAVAWGVYIQGIGILNGLASALVSSALIYGACDKLFIADRENRTEEGREESTEKGNTALPLSAEAELERIRLADIENRLTGAKEGFEDMSEVLYGISKTLRTPAASDLKQICDNAFDASCVSCERKPVCWGERYRETSDALMGVCSILQRKGSVGTDEADETLVRDCARLPDILSEINHNAYLHGRELLEGDRTEVFALDYSAVAEFMSTVLLKNDEEYTPDTSLGEGLFKELSEHETGVVDLCVFGKRRKRLLVFGEDRETLEKNKLKIFDILSESCPFPIDSGELDEGGALLRFTEKETISVTCAQRSLCADGEEKYCGDTQGMFRTRDGRLCAFISDGMGSGREAAVTSGIVGLFLRKFLSRECSAESVLKLLNGFLRNRNGGSLHECSATVDLMELDLIRERAGFYKSGAAPTYVFRNGSLFKLRSHTVPIGIIKELDFKKIDLEVSRGDIAIMVSDGVTDGKEECPWLFDLLRSQGDGASPERIADLIVKYAKNEGATDDVSVLVIKIV